jgi:hypothetical protein
VKWDVGGKDNPVDIREQDGKTRISFDTAWDPPLPAIRAMSALYPALTFELRYCELGSGCAGEARYLAGEGQENCYEEDDPGFVRIAREFGWDERFDEEDDDPEEDE